MLRTQSIRSVIVGLGAASILIAATLAGFGLLSQAQQLEARERVVTLEQALRNHDAADAFMDSARTDVLRSLQHALGVDHEETEVIRTELKHHVEEFTHGIGDNERLTMAPDLHEKYDRIAALLPDFVAASEHAVELALTDPAAGSANFEKYRTAFTELETLMDETRDIVRARVQDVREGAKRTATRARLMIILSLAGGVSLLVVLTTVAARLGQRITSDLATSRERAHHLALHDALTGLPNRALLAQRLEQSLQQIGADRYSLALLCIDLDRFKPVNDTLGHPVGDALLRAVADRLRACVRASDTVARFGGDEFAVIQAPSTSPEQAAALADRLVVALSEPYQLGEHNIIIGASVGVALAPGNSTRGDMLFKMADMALYRAKSEGRGTARFFEQQMDRELQTRRRLELDLRKAVMAQEFELRYQPLIDLDSGTVVAVEALIRWQHRERGLVSPDEFIPLAEETGLIVSIGTWVLRQACADAARWPDPLRVAVNISAVEFRQVGLIDAVKDALERSGLDPKRLEIEITETSLLTGNEANIAVLTQLRDLGVRIALDDFGTGYSSLSYLRSFPFDKIKIDRSFVKDICSSADCRTIVSAVTNIGTSLGIATTAEGVETAAQLDQVRAQGCRQAQGYLFSQPVPADSVPALLGSAAV